MKRMQKYHGEIAVFASALLWSFFPVVTRFTLGGISPLWLAACSTWVAMVFFACTVTLQGKWSDAYKPAWRDVLLTGLIIGTIFYALMFSALRYTTAGNAAMLSLLEILSSYLIISLGLRHEPLEWRMLAGSLLLCIGAALILSSEAHVQWNKGDVLVLLAVSIVPFGNVAAKRARTQVSSGWLMMIRSLFGACLLSFLAWYYEGPLSLTSLQTSWWLIVGNGLVLLGFSKLLWMESIHRIPITKSISLLAIEAPLTLLFAYLILGEQAKWTQIIALVPMLVGLYFLMQKPARKGILVDVSE